MSVEDVHYHLLSELATDYLNKSISKGLYHDKWKFRIKTIDNSPRRSEASVREDFEFLQSSGHIQIGDYEKLKELLKPINEKAVKLVEKAEESIQAIQSERKREIPGAPKVTISGKSNCKFGDTVTFDGIITSYPPADNIKWKCVIGGTSSIIDITQKKYEGSSVSQESPKLIINNVDLQDIGAYLMTVGNRLKIVTSNVIQLQGSGETVGRTSSISTITVTASQPKKMEHTNRWLNNLCRTLNTLWSWIAENTKEATVLQLLKNAEMYAKHVKKETNTYAEMLQKQAELETNAVNDLFDKIVEKVSWWCECDIENRIDVFVHLTDKTVSLFEYYHCENASVEKGSILLRIEFPSKAEYAKYKEDFKKGILAKKIEKLMKYEPYLKLFELNTVEIDINLIDVREVTAINEGPQIRYLAAIEIGTVGSGYAFSSVTDWNDVEFSSWDAGSHSFMKTANVVLLNPDQSFNAFGYEAQENFAELATLGSDMQSYYYFENFTTVLQKQKDQKRIGDTTGKLISLHVFFSHIIRYLVKQVLETIKQESPSVTEEQVKCILVLPVMMEKNTFHKIARGAFSEAGMYVDQLSVIREPDAAAFYHRNLISADESDILGLDCMIVNLGGEMSCITIHRHSTQSDKYKETKCDYVRWGGKHVDYQFGQLLSDIFGELLVGLKKDHFEDYMEMYTEFETQKCQMADEDEISLRISPIVLAYAEMQTKSTINDILRASARKDSVRFLQGKLCIKRDTFRSFFKHVINEITIFFTKILQEEDVPVVLLIGGFANSRFMQEAIKENAKGKRVILPQDASSAILKGAIYGHIPT